MVGEEGKVRGVTGGLGGCPVLVLQHSIQWNLSIAATLGKWHFGCYTEVVVVEEFYTGVELNWDQGYCPLYSRWLLLRGGH